MIGIKHEAYWRACLTVENTEVDDRREMYVCDGDLSPTTKDRRLAGRFETRADAEAAARRSAKSIRGLWDIVTAVEVEMVSREITGYSLPLEEVTK